MPPMILFILKALEGRGAERMVTTLASAYVKTGIASIFYVWKKHRICR